MNPHRNKLEKVGNALVIDLSVEAQGEGESQDGWGHEDEAPKVDHNCQNQHKHYTLERVHTATRARTYGASFPCRHPGLGTQVHTAMDIRLHRLKGGIVGEAVRA